MIAIMSNAAAKHVNSGPLLVVAAMITSGSGEDFRILIAKRRFADQIEPGKWEFPGGKVEFGETPQAALKREIREELDLEIEVGEFLGLSSHVYQGPEKRTHVLLLCYVCRRSSGELKHLAVQDSKWIRPNEIGHYEYAAADLPLITRAQELYKHIL